MPRRINYTWGQVLNEETGTVFWADTENSSKSSSRRAWVLCGSCGKKYIANLYSVIHRGSLCLECGRKKADQNRIKYHDGDILNKDTGSILIRRDENDSTQGIVRCGRCGRPYHTTIYSVVQGCLCTECAYEINSEQSRKYNVGNIIEASNGMRFLFIEELPSEDSFRLGRFVQIDKDGQKIGNSFVNRPNIVSSGKVNGQGTSNGELIFREMLNQYDISYQEQKKFDDLRGARGGRLSFDFAIRLSNSSWLLIEIDGEQHHKIINYFGGREKLYWQQKNDEIKNQYAKKNEYVLIRLSSRSVIQASLETNYNRIKNFLGGD